MKISTNNNIMQNYADMRLHTKENYNPPVTPNDGHSFDAIIIKSNPRQIEEHTFAKSVARRLSSEVERTASAEKIQNLQKQISDNAYHVDSYAIASRMLLI